MFSSFVVFCDSLSVLTLLQSPPSSHSLVLHILEWQFRLSVKKKSEQFCWFAGYVGIRDNEQVDGLVQSAITLSSRTSLPGSASNFFLK